MFKLFFLLSQIENMNKEIVCPCPNYDKIESVV